MTRLRESTAVEKRPNIVLIVADHQAYYGYDRRESGYTWPNYDAFARPIEARSRSERDMQRLLLALKNEP